MAATIPIIEPLTITAGDSPEWDRTISDYSPVDGWAATYHFFSSGLTPFSLAGTASGSTFQFRPTTTATAAWTPGTYRWRLVLTNTTTSERLTYQEGTLDVLQDPATATSAYDPRTHEEKCLAAIEAMLEGELDNPIIKYKIDGREVDRHPRGELLKLRAFYKAAVLRQQGKSPFMRKYPVRFTDV